MYSAMARRRTETNMQQLMCEVERLNVFRLLVEVRPKVFVYRMYQSNHNPHTLSPNSFQ